MNLELLETIRRGTDWEARRQGYPNNFPDLPPTPAARYTDPGFYALEQKHIFGATWMHAGHASDFPDIGSYRVFDRLRAPVFMIRSQDGEIRAFYNTCQHRGAPVLRSETGCTRRLTCQYHAWTYDTKGQLIAVPHERDFSGLDKSKRPLKSVRCEVWEGFIFLNLDDEAAPLKEFLAPIDAELADELSGPALKTAFRRSEVTNCNWKIAQEAFLEAYHVPVIHPQTADRILDYSSTTIGLFPNGHSRMIHKLNAALAGATAGASFGLTAIPTAGPILGEFSTAYSLFPNMTAPINTFMVPLINFWPIDIATTRIDWVVYGYGWEHEPPAGFAAFSDAFDRIMDEDFRNLAPMQASVASGALKDVPLGYQERRIYHFNLEVDRRIGRDRIPEALRVAPMELPLEPTPMPVPERRRA